MSYSLSMMMMSSYISYLLLLLGHYVLLTMSYVLCPIFKIKIQNTALSSAIPIPMSYMPRALARQLLNVDVDPLKQAPRAPPPQPGRKPRLPSSPTPFDYYFP
jgi:hypothetical protein